MTNTTSLLQQKNECDVITIFPMTVECLVNNPSSQNATDGSLSISITGGTPPYTTFWEIGSFAPTLTNLGIDDINGSSKVKYSLKTVSVTDEECCVIIFW